MKIKLENVERLQAFLARQPESVREAANRDPEPEPREYSRRRGNKQRNPGNERR